MLLMDSAFAKLGRAKAHYQALADSVEAWRARVVQHWSVSSSDHLFDKSLAVVRVHLRLSEEPPNEWGLIVGDILTNLPASLDHSIFSHVDAQHALTEAKAKDLYFPVVLSKDSWLKTSEKRSSRNTRQAFAELLKPAVLCVVEQSQPFTMDPPKTHALAELNKLVNLDKHCGVRVVSYLHEDFEVTHADLEVLSTHTALTPHADGAVVATQRVRRTSVDDRSQLESSSAGFHFRSTSFEGLELPSDGLPEEVRHVVQRLIEQVEDVLNCLRAVGC